MPVDYSPEAVERRLREAADATDLRPGRRLRAKIDYSPEAIERRLREVDRARRACLELGTLKSD